MKNKYLLLLAGVCVTTYSFNGFAAPTVPASADSGRIQQSISKERLESKTTNQVLIQDQAAQADVKGAEKIKLKLSSVTVSGNKALSSEQLSSIYADKIGHEITLADVYTIRDEITRKYRDAGYILSRAVVPQQQFNKNGANVHIQIIEGYVNSVTVQGDIKGNSRIINRYAEKVKKEGALNSADLERYLLLMNDLAGTKATAVLRPAAAGTGGTDIVINIEHDKVDGAATFDNSGSKFIGPYLASVEGNLNSALGMSEKITATVIATPADNELLSGQIAYKQPIGYEGTQLKFAYGRTRTNPGSTLENLDIFGDTDVYEAELTHPFLRSRKENLSGRINLSVKETDTDAKATATKLYDDKVRTLTLGGTYDLADRFGGVNLIDLSATQGVDVLDATHGSDPRSRANGDAVFTRYNYEASRTQNLIDRLVLFVASAGQYSNDGLLASEEFGFGGRDFGRGYDFSEITGDSGVAGKVELQYGVDTAYQYLSNMQLYSFYDIGRIWQESGIVGEDPTTSAASAGAGLRFNITSKIAGYTEVAKPLTKDLSAEGDRDVRFNFGLSYVF